MVQLTTDFLSSLRPSKHFPTPSDTASSLSHTNPSVTSLDFDSTGELLVVASQSTDSIQLFGCEGGESKKIIFSKKYGVGQIKFAPRPSTVIYTSTKGGDGKLYIVKVTLLTLSPSVEAIRYLSLHDNKYLRYFRGHTSRVTQLCLSPLNDTFISVAPEEALCLWDLRTPHMQGRLNFTPSVDKSALAAFDPQGLIFAVATASKYIRLYDARNWERGAFTTFELNNAEMTGSTGKWSDLQFSPDGKELLVGTGLTGTVGVVLDSFEGLVKGTLDSPSSSSASVTYNNLAYTPDSQYIVGGRSDGQVDFWTTKDPKTVVETIEGISREPINALAFNPKMAMLATVGDGTVFYI